MATILNCSPDLIFMMHELLSSIESIDQQNPVLTETLAKNVFNLFKEEFEEYSNISPSLHRVLQHSVLLINVYQENGYSLGTMSECAQEAIHFDSKRDVKSFSFHGSHSQQNLDCFHRNWVNSDFGTFIHAKEK